MQKRLQLFGMHWADADIIALQFGSMSNRREGIRETRATGCTCTHIYDEPSTPGWVGIHGEKAHNSNLSNFLNSNPRLSPLHQSFDKSIILQESMSC